MESDQKVMGIPQLIHFQTLITTGALFLGLMAVKLISSEASTNNIVVTLSIAILALFLLNPVALALLLDGPSPSLTHSAWARNVPLPPGPFVEGPDSNRDSNGDSYRDSNITTTI